MEPTQTGIGRITTDRRNDDRREAQPEPTLSGLVAFERIERNSFKRLDRRKVLRRQADIRRRIAKQ